VIVVDASVWVDFLRHIETREVVKLRELFGKGHVLMGDLVLCEILRGARNAGEAVRIGERLRVFPCVQIGGETTAMQAARNFRLLRRRGITIRSTIDLLIGAFFIKRGHALLHSDRDFLPMVEHLG
jgi:predicted nucleic acid-binding protein